MPPKMLKVKLPDNKIYEVPEHDLDTAISFGGEVLNDNLIANPLDAQGENSPTFNKALNNNNMANTMNDMDYSHNLHEQPEQIQTTRASEPALSTPKMLKVVFPDNKTYEVPEGDLKKAMSLGGKVVGEEPHSFGKFAARSAKTIGSEIVGSLPDLVSSVYNIPATMENSKTKAMKENSPSYFAPESPFPEAPAYPDAQLPIIPSVAHAVDSSIDEATGGYTKTKDGDSIQAGLRIATSVATPGGLSKLASNAGKAGAAKVLGSVGTTNPTGLAAAGATGAITSEAEKAGYGTPAALAIGVAGGAGVGAVAFGIRSLDTKLAIAKLTGNSPKNIDLKAVEAAASSGLEIPNTVANESKSLSHIEQVISKTPYFGTKYAKKLHESDQNYANKVQEAIANVGEKLVDSDSALDMGNLIKETFNDVKSSVLNEKDELYQIASSFLPEGAAEVPHHTINAIAEIRNNIKTLVPSPDQTAVLSYLDKIENGIVFGSGGSKVAMPVPIEMLVGSKVSINDIINWDINAGGAKKQLRSIQSALKEDLQEYGKKNPKWWDEFSKADEFYGKYLGDKGLASDPLKKIFSEQDPEKILPMLNKISDFKALETSLGTHKVGQQFFDSIKREKLSDLLSGKVVNPKNDTVNYLGFSSAMENKQNKELIKYLAGDNYKQLENLNTYAKAAMRHKARNPNPSGTAPTKLIYTMITGGVSGAVAKGAAGAVTGLAAPLAIGGVLGSALSWLVTNKKALNWGIEAARKQAAGDWKSAETISNRLMRLMKDDLGDDVAKQFIELSNKII